MKGVPTAVIPPDYTVTREGRVKGPSGRWLTPIVMRGGCVYVNIKTDGAYGRVPLSRLVCWAFHGPPPTPAHVPVNIDGDGLNNHADNLRWGTRRERRQMHGTHELPTIQGELHPNSVLTWDKVRSIRKEYAAGGVSQRTLARKYGVSGPTIHTILHNIVWRDPGYTPPAPRN